MAYNIKANRCEGWFQPIFRDSSGNDNFGAKWPSYKEAHDAILFHHKNGIFPSEVDEEEVEVNICEACGKVLASEG